VSRRILALLVLPTALLFSHGAAHALVWPDVPERIERALASQDPMARRGAAQELQTLGVARGTPLVLQALGDPDIEVKLAAAQSAVRLRVPGATEAVLPWLGDRESRLRIAACEVARTLPNPRVVAQLARALGDGDAGVRAAAADALGSQASADAVAPLLGKLDDASPPVRIQIARALARLGDKRAVVPLVGKVQDSVPDVRQAVARALGDLGDQRASQALLLQLRDNVNDVRVEALAALGRLRAPDAVDAIAPMTTERNSSLRQAAISALGRIGTKEAVRALVATLGFAEDGGGGLERTPVREALVNAGPVAVTELSALLQGNPTAAVATSAAWVLGELRAESEAAGIVAAMRRGVVPAASALHALAGAGTRDSIPVVLEFVGDANPMVRAEAARAASALLDPSQPDGRAVEPLAAALRNVTLQPSERATLAGLLGRTGAPRAAPVLIGLSSAKDPGLKLAAIDALGTLGPANADDALLEKLADTDASVRLHAAVALGDAGSARARDALVQKMESGEELDRAAVLTALGGVLARAPSEAAVQRLVHALELAAGPERDALIVALGRARLPSAEAALASLAQTDDAADRVTAVSVLAAHARLEPAVRARLADRDSAVRAQAAWALGSISDASAFPALDAAAKSLDTDAAINATAAIGRIAARTKSGPVAVKLLCPRVADARPFVRSNALIGLAASHARCTDGADRRALELDTNDTVRAAAASVLAASPTTPDYKIALDRCASMDRAGAVAHRCRAATAPPRQTARAAPVAPTHAVEIYVVPDGSTTPKPRAPYALEMSDGFVRAGNADRRGALFEPLAPDGDIALRRAIK
jgi:HEAT repeat protein